MNKYISIQDAEFDNNPLFILCAPHATGKTVALFNYISSFNLPCDYLYMQSAYKNNLTNYMKNLCKSGAIKDYPMIHFVQFTRDGSIISGKKIFNRLIIELDSIVYIDDLKTIIHKAFNTYIYYQVILIGTPEKFRELILNDN